MIADVDRLIVGEDAVLSLHGGDREKGVVHRGSHPGAGNLPTPDWNGMMT